MRRTEIIGCIVARRRPRSTMARARRAQSGPRSKSLRSKSLETVKVAVTKSMKEMANLRILSVESYLRELADADHATFRGQQLDVLPPKNEPRIKIKKQKGIRIDAGT